MDAKRASISSVREERGGGVREEGNDEEKTVRP